MTYVFTVGSKDLIEFSQNVHINRLKYICEHNNIEIGFLYNEKGLIRKFKYVDQSIELLYFVTEKVFTNNITIYSLSLNASKKLYIKYKENIKEVISFGIVYFLYQFYLGKYGVLIRCFFKPFPRLRQTITGPMFNGKSNIDVIILMYVIGFFPHIKYWFNKPVKHSILVATPFFIRKKVGFLHIDSIDFSIVKKIDQGQIVDANNRESCAVILGPSPTHLDNKESDNNIQLSLDMVGRLSAFLKINSPGKVDIWGHPRDVFFKNSIGSDENFNVIHPDVRQWKYKRYIVFHTTLLASVPSDAEMELIIFKDGGLWESAFLKYAKINKLKIYMI
jgi:hypothetical protein